MKQVKIKKVLAATATDAWCDYTLNLRVYNKNASVNLKQSVNLQTTSDANTLIGTLAG